MLMPKTRMTMMMKKRRQRPVQNGRNDVELSRDRKHYNHHDRPTDATAEKKKERKKPKKRKWDNDKHESSWNAQQRRGTRCANLFAFRAVMNG